MPSLYTPPFLGDDTDVMAQLADEDEAQRLRLPPPALTPQSMYPQVARNAAPVAPSLADRSITTMTTTEGGYSPPPGYLEKLNQLEDLYGQRPVRPEPKWWQRLGGAAAGFGAGWSNAASRTRHPIDIGQLHEDILAPGYQDKLARWQSQEIPLEAQANIEAQKQGAWWKNQEIKSRMARDQAYADSLKERMVEVTPEMSEATGGMFKPGERIAASTANEIARIQAGKYEKPEKTFKVTDPEIARRIGVAPGTDVPYSLYQAGMKPTPQPAHHNRTAEDTLIDPDSTPAQRTTAWRILAAKHPGRAGGGRGTDTQFKQVEQTKNKRLIDTAKLYKSQLANAVTDIEKQDLYDAWDRANQLIQDGYEHEITALGGEPEHFLYPSRNPSLNPQGVQSNRKPLTEIFNPKQQTGAPQGKRKPLSAIFNPQQPA